MIDHHKSAMALSREIRNRLECFIENTSLAKKTQNFIITVLLGDRAYLDSDTRAILQMPEWRMCSHSAACIWE